LSGKAGDAVGDSDTVSVDIWSGSSTSGSPLDSLPVTRSGDSWSVEAPQLQEGTYTVKAQQSDSRGNSAATQAHTFTVDTTPPDTVLTGGPTGAVASRQAVFKFTSTEEAHFQCQLDRGGYKACSSPASYDDLHSGTHQFQVRAVDAAGNLDGSPAGRTWLVLAPPAPSPPAPSPPPPERGAAVLLPAEDSLGQAEAGLPVELACRTGCSAK